MHSAQPPPRLDRNEQQSDFLKDHDKNVAQSTLLSRGWVLQERMLSRRIVDFSKKQIYWECRTVALSEDEETEGSDMRDQTHELLNNLFLMKIHQMEGNQRE